MNVLTTTSGNLIGSAVPFTAAQVLQIPKQFYQEQSMTRLGTNLTSAQQSALIPFSTTCPGWTLPIEGE